MAGLAVSDRVAGDIRLAVTEACTNAILHGYPDGEVGTVLVTSTVSADTLVVIVRDYGRGIATCPPTAGVGMPLMHALADSVFISNADPGAAVPMTFRLN